jgi:hypothetical protein
VTETADVIRFAAGDTVPDWILCLDPIDASSVADKLRFTVDVMVLDCDDTIVIVPLNQGDSVISLGESNHVRLFSEAKTVRLAVAQSFFVPAHPIPPGFKSLRTEDPPSAWWRRLWPFGRQR